MIAGSTFATSSHRLSQRGLSPKKKRADTADLDSNETSTVPSYLSSIFQQLFENLTFTAIFVYFSWLLVGVIWYKFYMDWTWATAFYYAVEAGLSIGYCSPSEKDSITRLFTICYILIGSSVVSGAIGLLIVDIFTSHTSIAPTEPITKDLTVEGKITLYSFFSYLWHWIKLKVGWYEDRMRTISIVLFVFWMLLGAFYCMHFEGWDFVLGLYWAVASTSTGGLQSAPCLDGTDGINCDIGNLRGTLMGTYLLIGVPIYAWTVGQFGRLAVERAMQAREEKLLKSPIETGDFIFAANVLSPQGSTTLVLGEYILLELMRLRQTTPEQIEKIKKRFEDLDTDKEGELTLHALRERGEVVRSKHITMIETSLMEQRRANRMRGMSGMINSVIASVRGSVDGRSSAGGGSRSGIERASDISERSNDIEFSSVVSEIEPYPTYEDEYDDGYQYGKTSNTEVRGIAAIAF